VCSYFFNRSEAKAGRDQVAGKTAARRAFERSGLVQATDQSTVDAAARAAGAADPDRTAAATLAALRARTFSSTARAGREHGGEEQRSAGAHQYFTQISSFAARAVSAVTPGVAPISSAVAGLAL